MAIEEITKAALRGDTVRVTPEEFVKVIRSEVWRRRDALKVRPRFESVDGGVLDLRGMDLGLVECSGADLRSVSFEGADLTRSVFARSDLRGVNLRGVRAPSVAFTGAQLDGADLSNSRLVLCHAVGASMRMVNLNGAMMEDAGLSRADLSGASFGYTDLTGAILASSCLEGANFYETLLSGADMSNVSLAGANGLPVAPRVANLAASIFSEGPKRLRMHVWHCRTAHCFAGHATSKAGDAGRELESAYGTAVAGALIWHQSEGVIPPFYVIDSAAWEWLEKHVRATGGAEC